MTFLENISEILEDVKVVLDIGSRWGQDAQRLQMLFPSAEIYAFECTPFSIELWKKDERNRRIHLIEKAVVNYTGGMCFNTNDFEKSRTVHPYGNQGANSIFKANNDLPYEYGTSIQNQITVPCITIQDWAKENNIEKIDVIWIDVQGAELMAFQGMGALIKTVRAIHTEVEYKPLYIGQPLFEDINKFLRLQGFGLVNFENKSEWFGDANYINENIDY